MDLTSIFNISLELGDRILKLERMGSIDIWWEKVMPCHHHFIRHTLDMGPSNELLGSKQIPWRIESLDLIRVCLVFDPKVNSKP